MKISIDQLRAIVPTLSYARATQIINSLNVAMNEAEINTPIRIASFVAQLAQESQGLTVFEENLNYSAAGLRKTFKKYFTEAQARDYAHKPVLIADRVYANRMGNGNEASGDGWKYRGRGPIQITGYENYVKYGQALGIDIADNPELASQPNIGFRLAGAYWKINKLNSRADREDIVGITKVINGGTKGLAERKALYEKAKTVLAATNSSLGHSFSSDPTSASPATSSSETPKQSVTPSETQQTEGNEISSVETLPTNPPQDLIKIPKISPSLKSQIVSYWQQLTGVGITVAGIIQFSKDHTALIICGVVGLTLVALGLWYMNRAMNRAAEQTKINQETLADSNKKNVIVVSTKE
jgi:putative chitinase